MTLEEIDLTDVPPAKIAKNAVFILAVQTLVKLLNQNQEIRQLLEFHHSFVGVLGNRRLGRLYEALAAGKDPIADLKDEKEIPYGGE